MIIPSSTVHPNRDITITTSRLCIYHATQAVVGYIHMYVSVLISIISIVLNFKIILDISKFSLKDNVYLIFWWFPGYRIAVLFLLISLSISRNVVQQTYNGARVKLFTFLLLCCKYMYVFWTEPNPYTFLLPSSTATTSLFFHISGKRCNVPSSDYININGVLYYIKREKCPVYR